MCQQYHSTIHLEFLNTAHFSSILVHCHRYTYSSTAQASLPLKSLHPIASSAPPPEPRHQSTPQPLFFATPLISPRHNTTRLLLYNFIPPAETSSSKLPLPLLLLCQDTSLHHDHSSPSQPLISPVAMQPCTGTISTLLNFCAIIKI